MIQLQSNLQLSQASILMFSYNLEGSLMRGIYSASWPASLVMLLNQKSDLRP